MQPLQHTTRSNSDGNQQSNDWNTDQDTNYNLNKEQIKKANAVPIFLVLKTYGLKAEYNTRHIACPFASRHKKGKDKSPSFHIYPNTNSFWCFGCKTGTTCVDFV